MGKLILIRHGETNKNLANSLHATNDQESLNDTGVKQMKAVADKLTVYLPSTIYSSKERRAKESAKIISDTLSVPAQEIDDMQERNWGVFTGQPWNGVKKVLDPMTLEQRYNYVPQNGESWKVFEDRLITAVKHITTSNYDKTVVIVTHGGAIRVLMPFLLGLPKEESFKHDPDNASLTIFNFDSNGFTQEVANDTSHLKFI